MTIDLQKVAELEANAAWAALAARDDVRGRFQARFPHYTPPLGYQYGGAFWQRWRGANLEMHGEAGFRERFPRWGQENFDPRFPTAGEHEP